MAVHNHSVEPPHFNWMEPLCQNFTKYRFCVVGIQGFPTEAISQVMHSTARSKFPGLACQFSSKAQSRSFFTLAAERAPQQDQN
eukprot:scaffold1429_cov110-Cylindrotheca_fusiformis.AAC.15